MFSDMFKIMKIDYSSHSEVVSAQTTCVLVTEGVIMLIRYIFNKKYNRNYLCILNNGIKGKKYSPNI